MYTVITIMVRRARVRDPGAAPADDGQGNAAGGGVQNILYY